MEDTKRRGTVALVGAGPGDPELMTVKGVRLLELADAVVYDALISPEILEHASATAERHFVGKRGGRHYVSQEETNALLLELARRCPLVVRLKGGDPYLFGRGAEEEAYLRSQGVTVQVVPGVTSPVAVPAAAGIPLTHRDCASAVVIATGHHRGDHCGEPLSWERIGGLGATVAVVMGVRRLSEIVAGLIAGGTAKDTPAAVIQWGTTPRQREVLATVGTIAGQVERAGLGAPSVLVVGDVVRNSPAWPNGEDSEQTGPAGNPEC